MKITAEIVNGKCPTCNQLSILVGITKDVPPGTKPFVRDWKDNNGPGKD